MEIKTAKFSDQNSPDFSHIEMRQKYLNFGA